MCTLQFCEADINLPFKSTTGIYFTHLLNCEWRPVFYTGTSWDVYPKWIPFGMAVTDNLDGYLDSNVLYVGKKNAWAWVHFQFRFNFPQRPGGPAFSTASNWFGLSGTTPQTIVNGFVERIKLVRFLNPKTTLITNNFIGTRYTPVYQKITAQTPFDTTLPLISYHNYRKWIHDLSTDTKFDSWEYSWYHTTNLDYYRIGLPIAYSTFNDFCVTLKKNLVLPDVPNLTAELSYWPNGYGNLTVYNDIVVRVQEAPGIGSITSTNMSNYPVGNQVTIWTNNQITDVTIDCLMVRRANAQQDTNLYAMIRTALWLLNISENQPFSEIALDILEYFKGNRPAEIRLKLRSQGIVNNFSTPAFIIDNESGSLTALFGAKEYLIGNKLLPKDEEWVFYENDDYWYLKSLNTQTMFNNYELKVYDYYAQNEQVWDGIYQETSDKTTIELAYLLQNAVNAENQRDVFVYGSTPLIDGLYLTSSDSFDHMAHLEIKFETIRTCEVRNLSWTQGTLPFTNKQCWVSSLVNFKHLDDSYGYYVDVVYAVRKKPNLIIFSDSSYMHSQVNICYANSNNSPQKYFYSDSLQSVTRFYALSTYIPNIQLFVNFA